MIISVGLCYLQLSFHFLAVIAQALPDSFLTQAS